MNRKTIRIAVLQFPGTNCEYETAAAVSAAGMEPEVFRWNRSAVELAEFEGFVIPGGFSYQDRIRAGAVAAKKSICAALVDEADKGKPILGICNGAQILVETGLVPGPDSAVQMALADNKGEGKEGYLCDWVFIRNEPNPNPGAFSRLFKPSEIIPIPIGNAEGRFVTQDTNLLDKLESNGQLGFRYCTYSGEILDRFPINPNGTERNLAGVYNQQGNVLALMPHPERGAWLRQIPPDLEKNRILNRSLNNLRTPAPGLMFFLSMKDFLVRGRA
ncbi:MAG: phosphoribosylformylglycinamidine synthase I [bacterium]